MIAVAALSARALAEWAAVDGAPAFALDLFGDADTRRAAIAWRPIGSGLRIDDGLLLDELAALARRGDVEGWVAGSGFDDRLDLLEAGARRLPLLGTALADQRRLRDARAFFATLDRLNIVHPPVVFEPPAGRGWLLKDPLSFGGAGVRRWPRGVAGEGTYWQREVDGQPMSATFIGNGADAVVLGLNRLLVRPHADRPFGFRGAIGPLSSAPDLQNELTAAVRQLAATFHLRGLGSLDFVFDGARAFALEVNARPTASAALYPQVDGASPLRAHVRACREGQLPSMPSRPQRVRGIETVFARRPLMLSEQAAAFVAGAPGVHDVPAAGAAFGAGDPLCSVGAEAADTDAVAVLLARRRDEILDTLEGPT